MDMGLGNLGTPFVHPPDCYIYIQSNTIHSDIDPFVIRAMIAIAGPNTNRTSCHLQKFC